MANKIRITLDPGHSRNQNRGVDKVYYEGNAMYDFAYQLKGQLEMYGIFDVNITRDKITDNPSLLQRANAGLNSGARVLISLHTNACGTEAVYRTVVYNSVKRKVTEPIAKEFSDAIAGVLKSHGQGTSAKVAYRPNDVGTDYYGILRNSTAKNGLEYVMLFEHDFHTNRKACSMLGNSDIMEEIAKAEAKVLYDNLKKYYIGDDVRYATGTVTGTLNVRCGPSPDYTCLGTLSKGATVKVISRNRETGWYKIIYYGAAAWVHNGYVTNLSSSITAFDDQVDLGLPNTQSPKPDTGNTDAASVYDLYQVEHIDMAGWVTDDATGKVNCIDGLNVRSGPGTNFKKLDWLPCGALVGIVPLLQPRPVPDPMNGWHYIIYLDNNERKCGFVFAEYIDAVVQTTPKAKVNATLGLNYRTGPGTTYKSCGLLKYGTEVYTLGTTNGWTKIRLSLDDTSIYYVSSDYLVEVAAVEKDAFWQSYQDCDYGKAISGTIYSSPNKSGSKMGNLVTNRIYCIVSYANNNEWAKIVCAQEFGYVPVTTLTIISKASKEVATYSVPKNIRDALEELPEMTASEWFIKTLGAKISSPYGTRTNPITGLGTQFHTGIDFACAGGTPIYTEVDGLCTFNAYDSSCGNMVILLDEMGKQHRFYHMKSAGIPKVGDFVCAGALIGYVGTTGDSTGNHLHYEVRVAPWTMSNTISPDNLSFQ